jgi:hypothetical protein
MLFANQTMIMFLWNMFCSLCRAMGFTSLLLPMAGYYTLVHLAVNAPAGTRNIYTRIWAGFLWQLCHEQFAPYVWGCHFVWVTDCCAVKFILSYNGANQAILRSQMQLMGWDMDIVH